MSHRDPKPRRLGLLGPLTLLAALVLATGCRTTHDATEEEKSYLASIEASLWSSDSASGDLGQSSVNANAQLYGSFLALRDADGDTGPGGSSGLGLSSSGREAWPDCVTETETGAEYDECTLSATGDGGSVSFVMDGYYSYTDSSAEAELLYDFGVATESVSAGWTFDLGFAWAWTETKLDGSLELDYQYGVGVGVGPTLGVVQLELDGTVEGLTRSEECAGPVAGVVDYRYTYSEPNEPPENGHVTVEWLSCSEVLITE